MAHIAVFPSLEGWSPPSLNHPAVQAYDERFNAGKAMGRDTDAAEDIVNKAKLSTDIPLMREEIDQLQNGS